MRRMLAIALGLSLTTASGAQPGAGMTEHARMKSESFMLAQIGLYAQALELADRAVERMEGAYGSDSTDLADELVDLAVLYTVTGDPARARALATRALEIDERVHGRTSTTLVRPLLEIASAADRLGDFASAAASLDRALRILESERRGDSRLRSVLEARGAVALHAGDLPTAETSFRRALAAIASDADRSERLGPLAGLGSVHRVRGDLPAADRELREALALADETVRDEVATAPLRYELAAVRAAAGDGVEAASLATRAFLANERLARNVTSGAPETLLAGFLDALRAEEELVYAMVAGRPDDPGLRSLALTVALLRKGRSIDERAQTFGGFLASLAPADQRRFACWRSLRGQIANLAVSGASAAQLADLERRAGLVERALAARVGAEDARQELADAREPWLRRGLPDPATVVHEVATALARDAVLVEVVALRRPTGPRARTEYLALVLSPDETIRAVPLGDASAIDARIARFVAATSAPVPPGDAAPPALLRSGRELYERIVAPVVTPATRRVLWSLDGALHLLPIDALHDGEAFLADRIESTYLGSGRDLLAPPTAIPSDRSDVVVADPDFGVADATAAPAQPSSAFPTAGWSRLAGTRSEADAIRRLLPQARVLLGADATASALLGVARPRILHVATHGVFAEPDARPTPLGPMSAPGRGGGFTRTAPPPDPLVRSALVLAGVARLARAAPGPDDGFATALEISGMDLRGTELVLLSACDTGRGNVRLGQGVYGLRRAVIAAGAETVVTSLWKVDDAATRDLMVRFYCALLAGRGRADALRDAERSIRARNPHPYYWAAFVSVGRSGPLRRDGAEARSR